MSSAVHPIEAVQISPKQLAANRANALKSTGPRSPAGKIAASMNSYRHGLTGNILVVALEEQPFYFQMAAEYIQHFQPWGVEEVQLVQKIVDGNWRLNRIAALENNLLNVGLTENLELFAGSLMTHAIAQAKAWREDCAGPNSFEKLGRYEQRLQNSNFKITAQFKAIRQERRDRELGLTGIDRPWVPGDPDSFNLAESQAYAWYQTVLSKAQNLIESLQQREQAEQAAALPEPPAAPEQSSVPAAVPEPEMGSFRQLDAAKVLLRAVPSRKSARSRNSRDARPIK